MKLKQYLPLVGVLALVIAGTAFIYSGSSSNVIEQVATAKEKIKSSDAYPGSTQGLPIDNLFKNPTVGKKVIHNITLTPSNTIILAGEIGAGAVLIAQQINQLAKSGRPMFLLINSPGGSVLDGNQIVDAIQSSSVPVYTVCLQLCASQAAVIFEFGTQRFMQDRSIVMFHEAAGQFQGYFNQMKSRMQMIDRLVNKVDFEIAKRVGLDYSTFRAMLPNELWLDGEDAVAQHFADKLVNVNLVISAFDSPSEKAQLLNVLSQSRNKKLNIDLVNHVK